MSKIRINELARQLEVKSREVIDKLHELGIAEKVTHSSSIDEDVAEQLRRYYRGEPLTPQRPAVARNGSGGAAAESRAESQAEPAAPVEPPARRVERPAPAAESTSAPVQNAAERLR